ncbi:hypothetical protein KA005_83945 [bacterium]|nr:hypothetical protein [bacterium]
MDIREHLKLIEKLFPAEKGAKPHIHDGRGLPLWINKSVKVVVLTIHVDQKIALVFPVRKLEFDQIVNIHRQVQKRMNAFVIIVVDRQNSKYRSLFVREGIPFIYRNETIFAPGLGVKLFNTAILERKEIEYEIREDLVPFEVKLLAGYLTDFLKSKTYNLDDILMILIDNNYKCSKGKLSNAVRSLLEKGIMTSEGYGPNRTISFKSKDETWEFLKESHTARSHRLVEGYYDLRKIGILSGETALAYYSDLSAPIIKTAALTNKEFNNLKSSEQQNMDMKFPKIRIQIRKETPRLFSIDGYLNPVEVFLDLRNDQDERIQISLGQMMNKWKFEVT